MKKNITIFFAQIYESSKGDISIINNIFSNDAKILKFFNYEILSL